MEFGDLTDKAILKELGNRMARYRLNKNMTQESLAVEAGVSRTAVQRMEKGTSIQLRSLLRLLRVLKLDGNLNALVPLPAESPIQLLKLSGSVRKRARGAGL